MTRRAAPEEMDLRIDRLANRVLLTSDEGAETWRARVDACSRTGLARALREVLPGVMESVGLGPEAEVVIARLRVRVVVEGEGVSEVELSDAWARAVAAELRAVVEPLARAGGGATSEVAVFADRFAAERQAVLELAAGLQAPWWWPAVSGGGDRGVAAVFRGWLNEAPERAPAAVAEVARASAGGLSGVLSAGEARALLGDLVRGRDYRRLLLGAPRAEAAEVGTGADGGVESWGADAAARRVRGEGSAALLAEEARVVGWSRGADVQRFVAACLVLARSPAVEVSLDTVFDPSGRGEPSGESSGDGIGGEVGRRAAAEEGSRAGAPSKDEEAEDGGSARGDVRPAEAAPERGAREAALRVEGPMRGPEEGVRYRVETGGLLFLVRRVARSRWLAEHRGEALSQRLAAFGAVALDRVTGSLPLAVKLSVFHRQWPLVQVFSAVPDEPPKGAFSGAETALAEIGITSGEVLSDATRLASEIASEIPAELSVFEAGARGVFGDREWPFAAGEPAGRLAALLCRPGHLRVSAHRAELTLPGRSIDVALRLGGWDIDPGFVPYLGRVIGFVYEEPFS